MENITAWISENGVDWGIKIAVAIAIFIIGKIIVRIIANILQAALRKGKTDEMLVKFLGNITYGILLVAVVLAAVDTLGVNVTSLMAILGAAGLAVGLALKDSLGNFAAGVMIIIFRPFKIGDFINAGGAAGVVDEIGLFANQRQRARNPSRRSRLRHRLRGQHWPGARHHHGRDGS
jgi:small conductance mechanosensitive channel